MPFFRMNDDTTQKVVPGVPHLPWASWPSCMEVGVGKSHLILAAGRQLMLQKFLRNELRIVEMHDAQICTNKKMEHDPSLN